MTSQENSLILQQSNDHPFCIVYGWNLQLTYGKQYLQIVTPHKFPICQNEEIVSTKFYLLFLHFLIHNFKELKIIKKTHLQS